jgi:hypothetical protein
MCCEVAATCVSHRRPLPSKQAKPLPSSAMLTSHRRRWCRCCRCDARLLCSDTYICDVSLHSRRAPAALRHHTTPAAPPTVVNRQCSTILRERIVSRLPAGRSPTRGPLLLSVGHCTACLVPPGRRWRGCQAAMRQRRHLCGCCAHAAWQPCIMLCAAAATAYLPGSQVGVAAQQRRS